MHPLSPKKGDFCQGHSSIIVQWAKYWCAPVFDNGKVPKISKGLKVVDNRTMDDYP